MTPLYTDVVSIYHSVRTGNKKAYGGSPLYSNVDATISPTGTTIAMSDGGVGAYELFEIFIYDTTLSIVTGDKVVTPSVTYLVDGVPSVVDNRFMSYIKLLARVVV